MLLNVINECYKSDKYQLYISHYSKCKFIGRYKATQISISHCSLWGVSLLLNQLIELINKW